MNGGTRREMLGRGDSHRLIIGLALLLVLLAPATAMAAAIEVRVSASIRPWLKFSATPRLAIYQVDAAAAARGYVDLPAALDVEVTTNMRDPILLSLAGGGPETVLALDGGAADPWMLRFDPGIGNSPVSRRFGLRILLPPGVGEGTYPLHYQVSAAMI